MKKWQVSLEIFHPQAAAPPGEAGGGGGGGQQPVAWVVSSQGDTIAEAINNFSSRSPRILFFAHNDLIVIGKGAAEQENLADILSLFFNAIEMRLRSWLLISDQKAIDVLTASWEMEQDISKELKGLIEQTSQRLSKTEISNLKTTGEALTAVGQDVITGKLEVFPTPEPQTEGQNQEHGTKNNSVRLHGSGVFSQGKLAGWFDDRETRGYLLVTGKAKNTILPLHLGDNEKFNASVRIIRVASQTKPEFKNGQVQFKVTVEGEAHFEELFPGKEKVSPALLEQTGQKLSNALKKEALAAITKAQAYRADVFGFGQELYRKHPHYWRGVKDNWREHFADLPVEVSVDITVRRTGAFLDPVDTN